MDYTLLRFDVVRAAGYLFPLHSGSAWLQAIILNSKNFYWLLLVSDNDSKNSVFLIKQITLSFENSNCLN